MKPNTPMVTLQLTHPTNNCASLLKSEIVTEKK
ncbi:hypothetical protein NIES932_08050 [Raphidiopsis curvata NIES-932]|nr:hypothetical protein NIES932_08050 [Raphidiopsis curvata NIES-932]